MLIFVSLIAAWAGLLMADALYVMMVKPPKTYKELIEMDSFKNGEEVIRGDKE